ncbi:MAG: hypothetical protein ACREBE_06140 [bacterium]
MTDATPMVGDEPTEPVDWSELWERGELVHYATGSICPFLGPLRLRALETDARKRNAEKYLLARINPLKDEDPSSLFILAVPKPKHVPYFVEASKGLHGGTPGRRLLGSIGLLHADRARVGWRVEYVQSHYNNTSDYPLKRSVATLYAGWANRAMQAVAGHVEHEGARVAFYPVTWVERERVPDAANAEPGATPESTRRVMVPQNSLSLSHFRSAFSARSYRILHLGRSAHFGIGKRSVLLALRLMGLLLVVL